MADKTNDMGTKLMQPWVPAERIESVLRTETAIFVLCLALSSWVIYKIFLKGVSPDRHRNLNRLFRNLLFHCLYAVSFFAGYWFLQGLGETSPGLTRVSTVIGMLAIFWGSTVFVKSCRILAFDYLFVKHMKVGVPVLIINLLSLLLSILLFGWFLSSIFGFNLMPLLATSAIFSIVLGLALQDTLGNLIAGVALQLDKPYEIGDWIEISNGQQKWVGQVEEISWRATRLLAFTEEWITIPNRVISQAEVANFSAKIRPFIRSQVFRIPVDCNRTKVIDILLKSIEHIPEISRYPKPFAVVMETTESWVAFKLGYYIRDYGRQLFVGHDVLESSLQALAAAGIPLANQRLILSREETSLVPRRPEQTPLA